MFQMSKKSSKYASEKHLLNVNSLDHYVYTLSDLVFLFLTLNKLLREPALVIKSLLYLFWHWFINIFSY